MKFLKLGITAILFAFLTPNASAGLFGSYEATVVKRGGSTNGWETIDEKHDPGLLWDTHSLTCLDPGNKACVWQKKPSGLVVPGTNTTYQFNIDEIQQNAETAISNGTFEGSYTLPNNGPTVTWSGSNTENYVLGVYWPE